MKTRRRVIVSGIVLLCAVAVLLVFSGRILWSLGAILDNNESPQKADMIVVIGGDTRGSRILTAAELARKGYAPKVLVSGGGEFYGRYESDLAVDFVVQHGYSRDAFIAFHYPALSTVDEARADIGELRRLGVHRYLLVTSAYHTARASRIFRREGSDLEVHPVPLPTVIGKTANGGRIEKGRKIWFTEAVKTIADYLHI